MHRSSASAVTTACSSTTPPPGRAPGTSIARPASPTAPHRSAPRRSPSRWGTGTPGGTRPTPGRSRVGDQAAADARPRRRRGRASAAAWSPTRERPGVGRVPPGVPVPHLEGERRGADLCGAVGDAGRAIEVPGALPGGGVVLEQAVVTAGAYDRCRAAGLDHHEPVHPARADAVGAGGLLDQRPPLALAAGANGVSARGMYRLMMIESGGSA